MPIHNRQLFLCMSILNTLTCVGDIGLHSRWSTLIPCYVNSPTAEEPLVWNAYCLRKICIQFSLVNSTMTDIKDDIYLLSQIQAEGNRKIFFRDSTHKHFKPYVLFWYLYDLLLVCVQVKKTTGTGTKQLSRIKVNCVEDIDTIVLHFG